MQTAVELHENQCKRESNRQDDNHPWDDVKPTIPQPLKESGEDLKKITKEFKTDLKGSITKAR